MIDQSLGQTSAFPRPARGLALAVTLLASGSLFGCADVAPPPVGPPSYDPSGPGGAQPVSSDVLIRASDGQSIFGTFFDPLPGKPRPVAVLLHQMCKDRQEWREADYDWVAALAERGIASLSIDLRGHGASTKFADGSEHDLCAEIEDASVQERYAGMVLDVEAAVAWANSEGSASAVGLVGSSIGANSALVVFGEQAAVRIVIALSPGDDYRNIKPTDAVRGAGSRNIMMLAAEDDARSAQAVREFAAVNGNIHSKVVREGGHGNSILVKHPDELARLVDALDAALNR